VLDEREPAAGLGGPDHEAHADRREVDALAVVRPDEPRALAAVEAPAMRVGAHARLL